MGSDYSSYVEGWWKRVSDDDAARQRARLAATQRLAPAVRLLVEDFGVSRVVLFGSAARGTAGADSDVDLAVQGLAPEKLLSALLALEALLGADRVDLVHLEDAGALLRAKVEQEGLMLYD